MEKIQEKKGPNCDHKSPNNVMDLRFTDFYNFCSFVLAYEGENVYSNTDHNLSLLLQKEDISQAHHQSNNSNNDKEIDKDEETMNHSDDDGGDGGDGGSIHSDESSSTIASSSQSEEQLVYTSDDESWNLVTCFCKRPFAGRPMVECSKCLTWIHLSCANIRKHNVPDIFICQECKVEVRRSNRRKH